MLGFSVWEAIQSMFNAETNRNVSTDKLRKLFARMVAARKKVLLEK